MTTTFIFFLGFIALMVGGGYTITRKWDYTPASALMQRTSDINQLTQQFNDTVRALESSFDLERAQRGWTLSHSSVKRQYSKRYQSLLNEYLARRRQTVSTWEKMNPAWCKARNVWGWIFVIGMTAAATCCTCSLPFEEDTPTTAATSTEGERYWNAETIPIPHLQDASQYVSNPDNILSKNTVNQMNQTLQKLDAELNIESVVIVVNHIENDDPYRMAQDVGNKYGVGKGDRGLVVVVGYLDHSINMSPGRSLEADLTDAECYRLQQQYVVPAMRAEMPDSGILYLTEAIFATMQKKELPEMSSLSSPSDETDDEVAITMGLYLLFLIGWFIFFLHLNRKYLWMTTIGAASVLSNPFYEAEYSGGFSGGGGGGFSGGGSFGGGSFGGGSFGGGGATSRW